MRQQHRKLPSHPNDSGPAVAVDPVSQQSGDRPGVLVVDDDRLVRIMVQLGLERNGFDVWLATTSQEAIDLYRKHRERIAVVLLEARLPGLDGPQTLDALRKLNPDVLACIMSGERGDFAPKDPGRPRPAYVIAKPFL